MAPARRPRCTWRQFFRPVLTRLEDLVLPSTVTWNGAAGNKLWNDAGNWVGKILPAAADDVVISASGHFTISLSSAAVSVQSLTCNQDLTVNTAAQLAVGGKFTLQNARELTVDGAGSKFSASGATNID